LTLVDGSSETSHQQAGRSPGDVLVTPIFNDWPVLRTLLQMLDSEFSKVGREVSVIVIDDGSDQHAPPDLIDFAPTALRSIEILQLSRNLGHQRAIAVGLSHIAANRPCRAVIVMDGDGEDLPGDVPRLLDAFDRAAGRSVVFAQRTRRSEGFAFSFFYALYRWTHRLLTGISVKVGNFSVIPHGSVRKLVMGSDLWNHYAAAVVHARFATELVPTTRGKRISGKPSMDFVSLVSHGLSAMSVFGDRIGVRLLLSTVVLIVALFAGVAIVAFMKLLGFTIPGWVAPMVGVFVILLGQASILSLVFVFMTQMNRARSSFIPANEFEQFVEKLIPVYAAR